MGEYNQYHPTVLGMEFPPLVTSKVLLDTATEIGYKFTPQQVGSNIQLCRVLTTEPPPGQALRKCLAVNMYPHSDAPSTGAVRTLTIPVASGSLVAGAANVGGATVADCVRNPSDVAYTSLTGASASIRLWFDTNATRVSRALSQSRILDVTVRYAVTGPFDTLPNGLILALERPSVTVTFDMDNALIGPVNQYDNVVPHRSRLGDLNPFWSTAVNPDANYERAPWVYAAGSSNHVGLTQLAASGGSNIDVKFYTSAGAAGAEFRIQYVALEVTYCNEDRDGGGGLELTPGAVIRNDMFTYDVPIGSVFSWGFDAFAGQGYFYDIVVAQGYCGALSVAYPVPLSVDRLSQGAVYGPHEGIVIRRTLREGEVWTREITDEFPALALYSSAGSPSASTIIVGSQTYIDAVSAPTAELIFDDEIQARIVDDVTAGTEYPFVRFYARVQPATVAEMTVRQVNLAGFTIGPEATMTVQQLIDLPEINDGWRQVTLEFDSPLIATGAGLIYITFDSSADRGAPWEILGADANPFDIATQDIAVPTYGGTTAVARIDDNDDYTADLTVMLVQAMPVIADVEAGTAVQALSLVDEHCTLPICGVPTGITYVTVTWTPDNSVAVAGFAYYEVQRRDTTMDPDLWETVATVSDVSQGAFSDYEARIGVQSSYRVRFVHVDGYTSDWSATVTATVAAPGVTGDHVGASVLVLTTNHNPAANVAHVMVWDGTGVPPQDFTFVESSQLVLQQMYQRDYRVAFRPLERGGVEFSRVLVVNALGVPPQTLSDGFSGLRDLAWDTVPYVCVRDEQSNRWLTAVSVPSGNVRDVPSAGHLMLAQTLFAEVTHTPAPIDYTPDCEGLILRGRDNFDKWRTTAGANILQGVLDVQDTFTRVVAGGWGAADTGETYTLSSAANSSVNGTRGVLTATAANAGLNARLSGVRDFYRALTQVVLPAVATGADYVVSQMFHTQNQIAFSDNFNRTTSPGWGTATTGQIWQHSDASLFSTTGTRGRINLSSTGRKLAFFNYGRNCAEFTIGRIGLNAAPTGTGAVVAEIELGRSADGLTRASLKVFFPVGGNIFFIIAMVEGGNEVGLSASAGSGVASSGAVAVRVRMNGYRVQARAWTSGGAEPGTWGIDQDVAAKVTTNTYFGLVGEKDATITNVTMQLEYDDVAAVTTDGIDYYRTDLICHTDASMDCAIVGRVANFDYTWSLNDVSGTYAPGTVINMDTIAQGFALDGRVWRVGDPDPPHNNVGAGSVIGDELSQMPQTGGGLYGLRLFRNTGNTNAALAVQYDNLELYALPTEFDVRFLIRPIADEWSVSWDAFSFNSAIEFTGEWSAELSGQSLRWYNYGAEYAPINVADVTPLEMYKNRLMWVRFNYVTDDGTGLGLLRIYTSDDGSLWTLKISQYGTTPAGVPPQPVDATMEVEAREPAEGVWIHKVEVRVDGQLLYSPNFAIQPPGTTSFEDDQGNVFVGDGGSALCSEQTTF
jgi:hypothetical protein